MAFSQKYSGKVFVPWYNSSEWWQVSNYLKTNNSEDTSRVLNVLKIWKIRTPLLSAGVEGTLIILNALSKQNNCSEEQLVQVYSLAFLRFLNLCATNNDRQGTFHKAAKKISLPTWMIDIRHDIAHGHKLPSKSILELALKESLQWLIEKYWERQDTLFDYIITEEFQNDKLVSLVKMYIEYNIDRYYEDDIVKLNSTYFEKVNNLVAKRHKIKTILINDGIGPALEELMRESFVNSKEVFPNITEILITENALLKFTPTYNTKNNTYSMPQSFRNIWTNFFNMIARHKLLYQVLDKLFEVTCNNDVSSTVQLKASLCIHEIFFGLNKCSENTNSLEELHLLEKSQSELFEEKVIRSPNTYTLNYLESMLKYHKNSPCFIEDMKYLVNSYINAPDDQRLNQSKIFTISDVPLDTMDEDLNLNDCSKTEIKMNKSSNSRWVEIQDKTDFEKCPLGILPQQGKEKNPLINF